RDDGTGADDEDASAWRRAFIRHYRAALVLPIMGEDEVCGSLAFYYTQPMVFTPEQTALAQVFAEQAALVIGTMRLTRDVQTRLADLEQRRRVAESLRDTLRLLNQDKPLQEILDHIVYQAQTLLGAGACVLHRIDLPTGMAYRQASSGWPEEILTQTSARFDTFGEDYQRMLENRVPTFGNYGPLPDRVEMIRNDPSLPESDRQRRIIIRTHFAGILALPMEIKSQLYGCMLFYYTEPQDFADDQIALASMFVEQAALAIENARLHQSEQARRLEADQRRRVAEGLRDILAILNSSRSLPEILNYIVMQSASLLMSQSGVLYRLDREYKRVEVVASFHTPPELSTLGTIPFHQGGAIQHMLDHEPTVIPDIQAYLEQAIPGADFSVLEPQLGGWLSILYKNYRAYLGVPLMLGNELYGRLVLYYAAPHRFSDEEVGLALAFSDQAALALENARLYDQVQENAAMAERNRLARDLHDSVTQTLFSASLIAKVLPRLWERDPEEGRRRLNELHQLTRGALAEMRTLLLELRPAALAHTELKQLLQHLVDAAVGRGGIPITLVVACDDLPALQPEIKLSLYRIVQEALNNVTRHADAQHGELRLACDANQLTLVISDDGVGFDPDEVNGDRLGLAIMQERAQQIGGLLRVESQPGAGTRITLNCTCPPQEKGDPDGR
ncbi:MAG: GAF domain-containing protein, partial [Anaerolineae bacterium]|nr:GAF domain-containing protein [Anaerolineae bacterium]